MPAVAQSMITRLAEQRAAMVAHAATNQAESERYATLARENRQDIDHHDAILATLSPLAPAAPTL